MTHTPAPPRLAAWIAARRLDAADREFALGDLDEDFRDVAARRGTRAARRWYWKQALLVATAGRQPGPSGRPISHPPSHRPSLMSNLIRDLAFSLRQVRRAPGASAAAILTYALGIGANIAIFSVAWPVLVSPLPFPAEAELVHLWLTAGPANDRGVNPLSPGDYADISSAAAFSGTAAYGTRVAQMNLAGSGETRQIAVAHVTPSFFSVMGIAPVAGRTLNPSDEHGEQLIVVLSERAWRTMFGADPSVIGRVVRLDSVPAEVVGVVPSTTGLGTNEADAWMPLGLPPGRERTQAYYIRGVARLAPGVSRAAANQELDAIMARAADDFPRTNRTIGARADSFREEITGPVRESLLALIAGAALLLVVAGINLAGLLVARNVQRAQEIGIRRALGASRMRLWSQLVVENITLAAAGGLLGVAIAAVTLRVVIGFAPAGAWHADRALPASAVLVFALALALVMAIVVSAVPAWMASSSGRPMLSHARGSSGSRAAARARAGVIGAQVALTVLLLVVATLVGTSLGRVLGIDPGFAVEGRLIADFSLPWARYDDGAARTRFLDTLVERAEALPGASGACAMNEMPLETRGGMTWVAAGTTRMVLATHKSVTAGCFDVLGVPLVRGRLTRTAERDPVVVLSESMARSLWSDGRDPVGERVHMGLATGPQMTVVGVVADIRNVSLEGTAGNQVWMPHTLEYFTPSRLVVSAAVPPASLAAPLRAIVRDLDPELALANVRTMDDIVGKATAPRRFVLWLMGSFAAIALLLSAIGIYGVLGHVVGQRAREIGIRRALGATTAHVTRIVAGTVGVAIAAGALAGLAAAWGVSAAIASLLFEMSATDGRVYAAVALFVSLVALVAAWPPARRAARVEPLRALRD